MAQFDVYINPDTASRKRAPFLINLQSDRLSELSTRLIAPLVPRELLNGGVPSLHLPAKIDNRALLVSIPEMASAPQSLLTKWVTNLSHMRQDIVSAIDLLVVGF